MGGIASWGGGGGGELIINMNCAFQLVGLDKKKRKALSKKHLYDISKELA